MNRISFEYDLKQEIKIKSINTKGFVTAYYVGENGIQYQIAYFLNGERKSLYLYPEEIDNLSGEELLGFTK